MIHVLSIRWGISGYLFIERVVRMASLQMAHLFILKVLVRAPYFPKDSEISRTYNFEF